MPSRREFMGAATAALSASSLLKAARPANDRINVGIIGAGGKGSGHVRMLKEMTDRVQVVAISDIYTVRKKRARETLGLQEKDVHHEYKDLLARGDVDAVFIATPDHWHFRMAMDALDAGKDVYLQKPMTYKIEEAKVISDTVKKSGRVLQVGSQHASTDQYWKAKEAIEKGLIGKPLFVQGTYSRNSVGGEWNYYIDEEGTPENIDWKRFLGPAPKRAFSQDRYFRWRKYWDYSGGISTDLLYHRLNPFLVALGPQFPVRVSANGGIYVHKDREVPDTISTTIEYPDFQVVMSASMASAAPNEHIPAVIYGHEATLQFLGKEIVITPEPIFAKKFKEKTGTDELHIQADTGEVEAKHVNNFLDCMRSRKRPNLNAEFGYQVMVAIGLGVEAYRESREMCFDPKTEKIAKAAPKRDAYEGSGKNDSGTRARRKNV